MPSVFSLACSAWNFYRKQPALNGVLIWMLILPLSLMNILSRVFGPIKPNETLAPFEGSIPFTPQSLLLVLPAYLILAVIIIWGVAAILISAKRILETRAGRSRTSFRTLRKEAAPFILPLLLTGVLRLCSTFLWGLLIIIPGVVYLIRTSFYNIVIVGEHTAYRAALHRSKDMVRGRTWRVFFYLLTFVILFFGPAALFSALFSFIVNTAILSGMSTGLIFLADVIGAVLMSVATILFLLVSVELYAELKKMKPIQVYI